MKKTTIFTKHPHEVRMTYLQHTRFALMLSGTTFICAIASLIHAFLPFLFVTHTSNTIRKLQDLFNQRTEELQKPITEKQPKVSTREYQQPVQTG